MSQKTETTATDGKKPTQPSQGSLGASLPLGDIYTVSDSLRSGAQPDSLNDDDLDQSQLGKRTRAGQALATRAGRQSESSNPQRESEAEDGALFPTKGQQSIMNYFQGGNRLA